MAIGGVGCAARIPVYLHAESLHGVHGRTLPWATGIKLHKPELDVVIFSGDGDAGAIGGNHLIQAARRNLDVTMIVVNNLTFAMTGGQVAPTTFQDVKTATTPYGNTEQPFDLCKLAETAGATFVSRWTTNQPRRAIGALKKAIRHKGFAMVEIITQCPTYFGRRAVGSGDPVAGVEWIKENSVTARQAANLPEEERVGKFVLGNFVDKRGAGLCGQFPLQLMVGVNDAPGSGTFAVLWLWRAGHCAVVRDLWYSGGAHRESECRADPVLRF